ncbi:MAG: PHP domain-containing protein [Acutalibacteraceae bacterium]
MSIDLHCHTKLSDGSLGIDDLIMVAKKSGMTAIAITDHDSLAGTRRGQMIGERLGLQVIPGVEFSAYDKKRDKKVHILCYLPEFPDRLEGLCRKISNARKRAGQFMILKAAQKYPITPDFVVRCASGSTNIYKQHIMHALVECGYTTTIYGELYKELFSPESKNNIISKIDYPEPKEIIEAIHEAGGIAVLAHAGWYDNFELLEEELIELGIDGVEVWHPKNSEEDRSRLMAIAKKNKLLMTGGSDFHGSYNAEPTKIGDCTMPQEELDLLLKYQAKKKRMQKKAELKQNTEA